MRALAACVSTAVLVGAGSGWALAGHSAQGVVSTFPSTVEASRPPLDNVAPSTSSTTVDSDALRQAARAAVESFRQHPCSADVRARFLSAERDYNEAVSASMTDGGEPGRAWRTSEDHALSAAVWELRTDGVISDREVSSSNLAPAYADNPMAERLMTQVQRDEDRAPEEKSAACLRWEHARR